MEIKNFDKLVDAVTKGVLNRMDSKSGLINNKKSCLILLPNLCFGLKEHFEYIGKNFKDYGLYLGIETKFSKLNDIQNLSNVSQLQYDLENSDFITVLDAADIIVVIGLKATQLKKLAVVDDAEEINHLILARVNAGKKVVIMVNSENLFFKQIANTLTEIRKLGIEIVNIKQAAEESIEKQVDLITENYVLELKKQGVKSLLLDRKQLITPLAKDKLREYKIDIKYHQEEK